MSTEFRRYRQRPLTACDGTCKWASPLPTTDCDKESTPTISMTVNAVSFRNTYSAHQQSRPRRHSVRLYSVNILPIQVWVKSTYETYWRRGSLVIVSSDWRHCGCEFYPRPPHSDGWPSIGGHITSVCNQSPRPTQPFTRSSSDVSAIRHVLPFLWMTSRFHIIDRMDEKTCFVEFSRVAVPGRSLPSPTASCCSLKLMDRNVVQ